MFSCILALCFIAVGVNADGLNTIVPLQGNLQPLTADEVYDSQNQGQIHFAGSLQPLQPSQVAPVLPRAMIVQTECPPAPCSGGPGCPVGCQSKKVDNLKLKKEFRREKRQVNRKIRREKREEDRRIDLKYHILKQKFASFKRKILHRLRTLEKRLTVIPAVEDVIQENDSDDLSGKKAVIAVVTSAVKDIVGKNKNNNNNAAAAVVNKKKVVKKTTKKMMKASSDAFSRKNNDNNKDDRDEEERSDNDDSNSSGQSDVDADSENSTLG